VHLFRTIFNKRLNWLKAQGFEKLEVTWAFVFDRCEGTFTPDGLLRLLDSKCLLKGGF